MRSITLDTSCAQHFLNVDEAPDAALFEVIAAAIGGKISVAISEEAVSEVARTPDANKRQARLARLKTFDCVKLPDHRHGERDQLAVKLHHAVFPRAQPGSRQDDHNWRDCKQMATHALIGRQSFLTRDDTLLRRAEHAARHGVDVVSARSLRDELAESVQTGGLLSIPSVAVRDGDGVADEADVRRVLAPLADDYPNFDLWLTRRLGDPQTRLRLGEYEGRVSAVALSGRKDSRVLKLSAFYVAEEARAAGLGGHLLWSEIRTWVRDPTLEKVYVTISSRHSDLLRFFTGLGFLVEGTSPRRYQDDTTEFVLAKHLVRRRVADDDIARFVAEVAAPVFKLPPEVPTSPHHWTVQPASIQQDLCWDAGGQELVAKKNGQTLRRWKTLDLEQAFHPLRLAVSGRQALMVPIERRWADAMVEYAQQQQSLGDAASSKLLLRAENAYYCYPKARDLGQPGTPILLYVTDPVSAVIGEARILDAAFDFPEDLLLRFGDLGIYGLEQIRTHAIPRGPNAGKALGLKFGLYVPFEQTVSLTAMRKNLDRNLSPQGLTPIAFEEFELVRRKGGVEW